jgi:RNA polymerase sigma factor (sigma-70 family)
MQEGYIALWKSCLKYDQSKNIKFCTFAVRQIYFSMLKYVYKIIHGKGKEIGFAIQNDDDKDLDMLNVYGEEDCNLLTIESKIYIEQILTNEPKVYMQIIELAQKGYTQQEIANEVHYSQCNISKMLKVIKQKIYSGLHD